MTSQQHSYTVMVMSWCQYSYFNCLIFSYIRFVQCVSRSVPAFQPMLTVAAAAVPAGGAAPAGVWGTATVDPVAVTAAVTTAVAAAAAAEAGGKGACWSRRARWPSLTIWIMASASASSWRTAAWMLLFEPKLEEPGKRWFLTEHHLYTVYGCEAHQGSVQG